MPERAFLFDVDGTLVDTNQVHVKTWKESFADLGYDIPAERIAFEIGKGGDNLIPDVLGKKLEDKDGDQLRENKKKRFMKAAKELQFKLFPKTEELLKKLKRLGYKTAIATSAGMDEFQAIEKNTGQSLEKMVDVLATASDAESSKPDPDIIQATLKKLGLPAKNCVMVGDTPYDAISAKKARVKCIGLLSGFHTSDNLKKGGALITYKDINDLYENIDEALKLVFPE
jgi:HAD superfamily hydrolase (TIGR01549 family)